MKLKLLYLLKMVSKNLMYGLLLQCLFLTTLMAHDIHAQVKPIDKTYVVLAKSEWQLQEIFKNIENITDYKFVYPEDILNNKPIINTKKKRQSVNDLLVEIGTAANLKFKQVDNSIYVGEGSGQKEIIQIEIEDVTVTGKVIDERGDPLPGATITVFGTATGTVTDLDGNYTLSVPDGSTLVFSYIGFATMRVAVDNRSQINITLKTDMSSLDEVVVTGYSSQRKKDITGSVSVVDVETLQSIPSGSITNALQGQASGVTIVNSGAPGGASQITIRGMTSFGNNDPLVLIDGIEGNIDLINVNEVESIQVLKDAGSAAIYGVRGSNGVIIVTTKKAKAGVTTVSYDAYVGVTLPASGNPLNLVNSEEWWKLMGQGFPNDPNFKTQLPDYMYRAPGAGAKFAFEGDPAVDPSNYVFDSANPTNNYIIAKINKSGTDWYHEVFKPALQNNHTITVSGGSDKAKALLSLNYLDEQGTVIETFNKRFSARVNSDFKIGKNIRIGENINIYSVTKNRFQFSGAHQANVISRIFSTPPLVPVYDISGINYNGAFTSPMEQNSNNSVYQQKSQYNGRNNNWTMNGNVYAEVDFLKHFTVRSSFGGRVANNYVINFSPVNYTSATDFAGVNALSESSGYSLYSILTNTLKYKNSFGNHKIDVLAGSEAIEYSSRSLNGSRKDFYLSDFSYLVLGNGKSDIRNGSGASKNTLFSLFGRLNYSYKDKYLLGATIRRDGSSKFGTNSRYGLFPSLSLGWRLSSESFMKDIAWLNDLKLRASYGELGSQANVNNANAFSLFGSSIGGSYYSMSGSSTQSEQGYYPSRFGNANTGWEKDIIYNVGLDATILGNIDLSVELYQKNISGLLFPQPVPNTAGGASSPFINIGDIENRGFDFSTNYRGRLSRDLDFTIGANITHYVNEIISIPGDSPFFDVGSTTNTPVGGNRNQVGHSMGEFYGYQIERLFQSEADITASPTQQDAAQGRFKYMDINGDLYEDGKPDGKIDSNDRTFIGSPHPKFTYGINLGMNYKNFDFSTVLYGSYGNKVMNVNKYMTYSSYAKWQLNRNLLDQWSPTNASSNIPEYGGLGSFSSVGTVTNSFYIEDGSFLKMRSLVLGYSLPAGLLEKVKINKLRIYAQATNLFQITKYSGIDPEIPSASTGRFGVDYGNYPNNQMGFNVGVNIVF